MKTSFILISEKINKRGKGNKGGSRKLMHPDSKVGLGKKMNPLKV